MADTSTTNTLKLVFTTEASSTLTLSLKYALDSLADAGDDSIALIENLATVILVNQPFEATLVSYDGATYTASTVTTIDGSISADDVTTETTTE